MKTELMSSKENRTSFTVNKRTLVIRIGEDLDHHNALYIREEADKRIAEQNIRDIVFDFSGVEFMDSSGIGVIMGRYKRVIFIGGQIAVACVNEVIDRILLLSGLYKIMKRYDNVSEAVKSLNAKGV